MVFPKTYAGTARHPDNLALLNALGAHMTEQALTRPKRRVGGMTPKGQYPGQPKGTS